MTDSSYCPECEIRALQLKITPQSIQDAIKNMAFVDGITSPADLYNKRMEICSKCTDFISGMMCAQCGSYVAYRARILNSYCPFPGNDKWKNLINTD